MVFANYGVIMHMEKIKFSIIIATYNRLPYLQKCLESLLNQNYPKNSYEIIVVNDGSSDGTGEYLKDMSSRFPSLLIHIDESHKGLPASRNKGASASRGEILAYLDDDCITPQDWLSSIESVFQNHPEIAALGSHTLLVFKERHIDKRKYWGSKKDELYMPFEYAPQQWLSGHNFAVKKEVFKKIGGWKVPESLEYEGEDLDLMYRLIKAGYKLLRTNKTAIYHNARETLKDIFIQQYIFGKMDTGTFTFHFPKWFVLDFYIGRFLNLKEFFYIKSFPINTYIRIDFFKLFIVSIFLAIYSPLIPLGYLFFMWLVIFIKEKRLYFSFKLMIILLTRDLAYMAGHIKGSIRYRIIYL